MQSFKLVPKITSSGYIVGHCTKIMAAVFLTKKKSRYTCVKRLRLATNLPRPKKVAIYLHKTYSVQKKSLGILSKKLQRLKKAVIYSKKKLSVFKRTVVYLTRTYQRQKGRGKLAKLTASKQRLWFTSQNVLRPKKTYLRKTYCV